jgi:ornithine carbamoyltransferase
VKHFISVTDLTKEEFGKVIDLAIGMKADPEKHADTMKNKTLIMYFEKPSTRTRLSFESGFTKLGGHAIFFTGGHLSSGKEDLKDTAAMYSRFGDIAMARVFKQQALEGLSQNASVPIISGLSDIEHPCQALADLMTIKEKKGFSGVKLAYLGDGNNVCNSLALACAYCDVEFAVATPEGYEPDAHIIKRAKKYGCNYSWYGDPKEAVADADAVYTDVWVSMGEETEKEKRMKVFPPYQVNAELMEHAKPDAIFMHCLPALKGYEVTKDVIEGPQSVVYDQAENRMWAQNALMVYLMSV